MDIDRTRLSAVMRRAALEAGARIMEIYDSGDLGTRAKDDDSPLTRADEAADACICEILAAEFPDIPLVTEEQSATHSAILTDFLIVDPLDGTREFVNRRGDFTVNIALVTAGEPRAGVVYAPAKGRLFYTDADGRAVEEDGALDLDAPGPLRQLHVAEADATALRVVASKSHRDAATDAYIGRYRVADLVSAGSSLKFCLVAAGEADLYPRLGRTMEWDTAAGDAVLRAAGGRVLRLPDLAPLAYGKPGFANPGFVAAAPSVALVPDTP